MSVYSSRTTPQLGHRVRQVKHVHVGVFRPTPCCHLSVPGVQCHHHPLAAKPGGQFSRQVRILHGRGADNHPVGAPVNQGSCGGKVPDAPADLDGYGQFPDDLGDFFPVGLAALGRAVKVYQVEAGSPLGLIA